MPFALGARLEPSRDPPVKPAKRRQRTLLHPHQEETPTGRRPNQQKPSRLVIRVPRHESLDGLIVPANEPGTINGWNRTRVPLRPEPPDV
jgi:hypothetical protein